MLCRLQILYLTIRRQNYNGDKPPSPDFLQADMRTVSFGTKIDHPPDAKANQECVELSAWYGRSGSMVCAVRDGRPVVVGMGKFAFPAAQQRSAYI
jgi:hypothetical protein